MRCPISRPRRICTLPAPRLRRRRALYAALRLLSAALLVFCAAAQLTANTVWYVTLPQALSLFLLNREALLRVPLSLAAAAAMLTVWLLERRTEYKILDDMEQ